MSFFIDFIEKNEYDFILGFALSIFLLFEIFMNE